MAVRLKMPAPDQRNAPQATLQAKLPIDQALPAKGQRQALSAHEVETVLPAPCRELEQVAEGCKAAPHRRREALEQRQAGSGRQPTAEPFLACRGLERKAMGS